MPLDPGRPRSRAQRPLPSMIMQLCRETALWARSLSSVLAWLMRLARRSVYRVMVCDRAGPTEGWLSLVPVSLGPKPWHNAER
ncbi:MAG: hypothetical protein Ct9H300mP7_5860 [Verrucomicrobiota bacterium]|nr:MAG: hypothetical protein Ct9H300mP7_5860 [Verrucomicrobiota bacterium]